MRGRRFNVRAMSLHEHFGANADRAPDPTPRSYRFEILVESISEPDALDLAGELADALAARGHALYAGEEERHVRSVILLSHADWPAELVTDALHAILPCATPRPPDLEFYSPN
jgi:hypothetical protein